MRIVDVCVTCVCVFWRTPEYVIKCVIVRPSVTVCVHSSVCVCLFLCETKPAPRNEQSACWVQRAQHTLIHKIPLCISSIPNRSASYRLVNKLTQNKTKTTADRFIQHNHTHTHIVRRSSHAHRKHSPPPLRSCWLLLLLLPLLTALTEKVCFTRGGGRSLHFVCACVCACGCDTHSTHTHSRSSNKIKPSNTKISKLY